MIFKKFSSIENSYRQKTMDKIQEEGFSDGIWFGLEKIHGANASLWHDGKEFKFGNRSKFIHHGDDSFFNCWRCIESQIPKIEELYLNLQSEYNFTELTVYGELCGGEYPHPDIQRVSEKKIQKGIWYSPRHEFIAFGDIKLDGIYITHTDAVIALKEVGIDVTPSLGFGTFKGVLEIPNDSLSFIPKMFGLPEIEDNIIEGVVLKPNIPKFFHNGSRVILKNKNERWTEKARAPKVPKAPAVPLKPEEQEMFDEAMLYVTENRLKNVLSKIGTVTNKDFGKIQGLLSKDSIEDFMKDFGDRLMGLDKDIRKKISKAVSKKCANTIRPNFLNILDNNF